LAGWLYCADIESILGLRVHGDAVLIDPCIPTAWSGFEMTPRYGGAVYGVSVRNPGSVGRGIVSAELDGVAQPAAQGKARLQLRNDHDGHVILVLLG
jgi:cyclic beta-1,2-glucan synthetase